MSNGKKRRSGKRNTSKAHHAHHFGGKPAHVRSRRKSGKRSHRHNTSVAARHHSGGGSMSLVWGGAGGLSALIGSHFIAESFLSQYNSGIMSYLITAGLGLGISVIGGKITGNKSFTHGGLIGTLGAVAYRVYQDNAPTAPAAVASQVRDQQAQSALGTYVPVNYPYPAPFQFTGGPGTGLTRSPGFSALQPGGPAMSTPGVQGLAARDGERF